MDDELPDSAGYYVLIDNVPVGPHNREELQDMLRAGRITPETVFCPPGKQQWRPLYELFNAGDSASRTKKDILKTHIASRTTAPKPPVVVVCLCAAVIGSIVTVVLLGGYQHISNEKARRGLSEELKELSTSAEAGDDQAQYELGLRNHFGIGIPKNANAAYKWLQTAATNGNDRAFLRLGAFYEQAGNKVEAAKWYYAGSLRCSPCFRECKDKCADCEASIASNAVGQVELEGIALAANIDAEKPMKWFQTVKKKLLDEESEKQLLLATYTNAVLQQIMFEQTNSPTNELNSGRFEQRRLELNAFVAHFYPKYDTVKFSEQALAKAAADMEWGSNRVEQLSAKIELRKLSRGAAILAGLQTLANDNGLQTALGKLYLSGEFGAINRVEAYRWLTLAAEKGDAEAKAAIEKLEPVMDLLDIREAEERVRVFKAAHNHP